MRAYELDHLDDQDLLRALAALVARERTTTTALLAHLAEVDARRLYLPAGYPSMYAYCTDELHLSETAAYRRIQAARVARQFPVFFEALADGRLNLTGVVLLAPYLTPGNARELIDAAARKRKSEIEEMLARRFPRSEMMAMVEVLSASTPQKPQLAPERVGGDAAEQLSPGTVEAVPRRPKVTPLAPERFGLQLTIGGDTHAKLQYAKALLSHAIPSGDLAAVLDRALDALIRQLENRKFAATGKPRPRRGRSNNPRLVPARVRRAVCQRDQGQCTFVGATGHRCRACTFLEFDHIDPVARGGQATVEGMRLRCRAHNQYEADCAFGAGFMTEQRERARHAAEQARDAMACLRELGFRAEEARRAIERCDTAPDATLEERVRAALKFLGPKPRFHGHVGASQGTPA